MTCSAAVDAWRCASSKTVTARACEVVVRGLLRLGEDAHGLDVGFLDLGANLQVKVPILYSCGTGRRGTTTTITSR